MNSTQQLTCPKCRGAMASYERSGIVVDQCTDCRGLFLDHGELERFIDLASGMVAPAPQPQWSSPAPDRDWRRQPIQHQPMSAPVPVPVPVPPGQQVPPQHAYQQHQQHQQARHDWDDDSDSDRHHRSTGAYGQPHQKKRKSMLKELLDF